jgi:hypothetical protein
MRIMFTIAAVGEEAEKAAKVKEKLEAVMREYGLEGNTNGEAHDNRANYTGMYGKTT